MSLPREGSRTIGEGIIVSEAMDWCKSPSAIVPYRIHTRHQVEGAQNADSVRQTDERSHVKGSLIRECYGDEPGVGGGVISGTHNAECTPKTWSSSVRAEGRNMVRHDDEWWMNHKNTWGRLTYVKDTKSYDTAEAKDLEPLMDDKRVVSDATPDPIKPGQQYAQAVPMPVPGIGPMPLSPEQSKPAADALWKGMKGLAPAEGETFSEYMQRPLYNLGIKKKDVAKPEGGVRVSRTGNCKPDEHRNLQDRVDNACGAAKACKGGDPPEVTSAKIAAHYECIRARERINNTCFGGGDEGHNDAIRQRKEAIAICWGVSGGIPRNKIPRGS